MPIGHYTDYDLKPTCGLATEKEFIGRVDEPKYFMDPKRMDAEILWFTEGFIQYNIANFLQKDEKLQQFEISLEISSEFLFPMMSGLPTSRSLKRDRTWYVDKPGDFADTRGSIRLHGGRTTSTNTVCSKRYELQAMVLISMATRSQLSP